MAVLFHEAVYLTGIFLIFGTIGNLEMTEGAGKFFLNLNSLL